MKLQVLLRARAPKMSDRGFVDYELLVDEKGVFYVKLTGNDKSGSFPNLIFPVAEFAENSLKPASLRDVSGLDPNSFERVSVGDENVSGFLKAALRDVLPR